jgi:hypothetical protein
MTSKAEYTNSETVICTLPGEGLYEIAVSNNGQTTSVYKTYIIYNSYCDRCTDTGCTTRVSIDNRNHLKMPQNFHKVGNMTLGINSND